MGFVLPYIEGFIRERLYRELGDVLLIGRQAIYATPQEILALAREHGLDTGDIKATMLKSTRAQPIVLQNMKARILFRIFRYFGYLAHKGS